MDGNPANIYSLDVGRTLKPGLSMGLLDTHESLPCSKSSNLILSHPTHEECRTIWKLSFTDWGDALSLSGYLEESHFLTSVPLAKEGGMSIWILVDKYLPPDRRPILCSCETIRKRAFVKQRNAALSERIVHGVASVFCNPAYRHRGYASRLMLEMSKILPEWQNEGESCVGSVLYSDIGKMFYAGLGWHPFSNNNMHIELLPGIRTEARQAKSLYADDLEELCKEDEFLVGKHMTSRKMERNTRMMLVPDHDHMIWHHKKEEFVCERLFGKQPTVKGAITGRPGHRVWIIWTHRFYQNPRSASSGNTLYILRLVIEDDGGLNQFSPDQEHDADRLIQIESQAHALRAVLECAQAEADEWNLGHVNLWHPTPLVCDLLERIDLPYRWVDRENEGIGSLLWFGEGSGKEDTLEWIGNEKFGWC